LLPQPQQGQAQYYSFPSRAELEEFFALGYQLFDQAKLSKSGLQG